MSVVETKLQYSNPRKSVAIDNWPAGGRIVTALFSVEQGKGNLERAVRVTSKPGTPNVLNAPKKLTYARKVVYVDGSDGRLYILELAANYNFVTVMRGTFDYNQETIHSDDERHQALIAMLNEVAG
jgi:hypothetical protein